MMYETLNLIPALAAGLLLGAIFFGGLWWTVQKGLSSNVPAVWFLVSMLFRTGMALAGFYFVSRGHWERLCACLIGFLIARILITRVVCALEGQLAPKVEVSCATQP
jgi:F1F0 ATPase subunit 2